MNYSLTFCFVLFVSTNALAGWSGPHKKHSFPQTFQAGRESDGRPLFISQCVHRETKITTFVPYYSTQNKGWHIGKAGVHINNGMAFSWGGKEYDSSHCRHDEHFVYIADEGARYNWISATGGAFPNNAVQGYNGDEQQRICRVNFNGGVHPGKLIPASKACFIGWGGKEHGIQTYEVLVKE